MHLTPALTAAVRHHAAQDGQRSFYLYDTAPMQRKIAALRTLMPTGVEIFYAMKANPHPAFLAAALAADVVGVEIASLGEARKAVAAGFTPERLIFTGPGKAPEELAWSVAQRIRAVHLESLTEAYRLEALCAANGVTQDVLLRVNPNFDIHGAQASFSGGSQKLGVDVEKLHQILPHILALKHLRFQGLHVYAASGVLRVEDLLQNCRLVFTMVHDVETRFPNVRCATIDFGGGFGVDYLESGHDFAPEVYAAGLKDLIATHGLSDRRFVLELGRYLTADSGWYCTEILDIKTSHGTKQVVCAGGTNHFRRPAALSINHPVVIVPMQRPKLFVEQESVAHEKIYIGGPLCNTADKLAKDILIDAAAIGDMAVFCLAGAYGLTMSHLEFLSHDRPPEIVVAVA
jgi:diaminopimelate decarboxylase